MLRLNPTHILYVESTQPNSYIICWEYPTQLIYYMFRVLNPACILYVLNSTQISYVQSTQPNSNIICSEYSIQLTYYMFRVLNPAHILYIQSTQPSSHIICSEYSTQPRYFILRLNPTKVSDSYYSIKSLYLIYSDLDIYLFLDLLFFIQTWRWAVDPFTKESYEPNQRGFAIFAAH